MEIILRSPIKGIKFKKWPEGDILQHFGENRRIYSVRKFKDYEGNIISQEGHSGIDFRPKVYEDIDVLACHDGSVYDVGDVTKGGKYVRIRSNKTSNYYMTIYGHLSSISVKKGQKVKAGEKIGTLGNSGYILNTKGLSIKSVQTWGKAPAEYGYHLHLTLRVYINGRLDIKNGFFGAIDPLEYFMNEAMLHHTAVSIKDNSEQFDAVKKYHISKGWGDIGYHVFIETNGERKLGRAIGTMGAHTIGQNHKIGICLAGNFDVEKLPKEQLLELSKVISDYGITKIEPHRKYADKSCPGKNITDEFINNLLNKKAMKIIGDNLTKNQFALGGDGKIRLIYNSSTLEEGHKAVMWNKNDVKWVDGIMAKYERGRDIIFLENE